MVTVVAAKAPTVGSMATVGINSSMVESAEESNVVKSVTDELSTKVVVSLII